MINNRQNGRRRGRGGQQQVRNGQPSNQDRGNRIDNRARGNAAQLLEKYKSLARDAQMQGDRVNTEYYLQFADHYFRVLSESRARFEEQRPNDQRQPRQDYRDEFGQDGGDDEAEGQRYDQADNGWNDGEDERMPPQRQPEPRQPEQRQPERQPEQRQPERRPTMQPRYAEQAPVEQTFEGEPPRAEGDRRPRRQRNGNGRTNAFDGNGQGDAGQQAAEPASERIEIDRLPQSLGAAPAANEGEPVDGDEAARPRRRAPRRPRGETAPIEA